MLRKTKIICTIGPACENEETLTDMCRAGMNVARLNFSHGNHEEHLRRIQLIRSVREKLNLPIAIMLDTKGPEYRIKTFRDGKVTLKDGAQFSLTTEDVEGDEHRVSVTYANLTEDLELGDTVLINNGLVILKVEDIRGSEVVCRVQNGGVLSDRKSMNFPGKVLRQDFLSEQDKSDLLFGIEHEVDFVAASFVSCREDVQAMRNLLDSNGGKDIDIIAKIENRSGVENVEEICQVADGIMVARGDLGVEIPAEDVPLIQKEIIAKCNRAGKPVIVATQMLESMTSNPRPTRAEASDVANAILDGTDAIMLSGETASGDYPAEAVETMARIAERTERALSYREIIEGAGVERHKTTEAIAHATVQLAYELGAKLIITPTASGYTTRMVSKYRPKAEIFAFTASEQVARHLNLRWGVEPVASPSPWKDAEEMADLAAAAAKEKGLVAEGDRTVITSGIKVAVGNTNAIRVYTVK